MAGAQVPTQLLLLTLGLKLIAVDVLGAAHRNPYRISCHLMAQPIGPFCHVALIDLQLQTGGHRRG